MEPWQLHLIDRIQMMIVPHRAAFLRIDILSQGGSQIGRLQVMGSQRVSGQHRIHVARLDQLRKGISSVIIKGKRRAHDPNDLAVLPLDTEASHRVHHSPWKRPFRGIDSDETQTHLPADAVHQNHGDAT